MCIHVPLSASLSSSRFLCLSLHLFLFLCLSAPPHPLSFFPSLRPLSFSPSLFSSLYLSIPLFFSLPPFPSLSNCLYLPPLLSIYLSSPFSLASSFFFFFTLKVFEGSVFASNKANGFFPFHLRESQNCH